MSRSSGNVKTKYTIIRDRVEIYKDFNDNLLEYIYDFYLGKETLSEDGDIKNYFKFCYSKVCDEFIDEEINFTKNEELYDYYLTYYYHQFFKTANDVEKSYFENFWENIFNVDKPKSSNLLKVLVELYTIFDKSISSNKNILELV